MMRVALAAMFLLVFAFQPAQASHYRYHRHKTHWSHHSQPHYYALPRSLPAPCRVAASMGGPCGCWAAYTLLGVLDHVWHGINLWLANDWMRFPHVAPDQATAVVWPNRHVAPIVPGTYHDGTVVVRDSWATHRVRTAGLVFVQSPIQRRELIRYAGGVPL